MQPAPFIRHRTTTWSANHRAHDASAASALLTDAVPSTKQQPPLMSLLGVHALPIVNVVMRSLKLTMRSRAVRISTIKIGFDPAADSIWIRSIKIRFEPNSVLESVRTLVSCTGFVTEATSLTEGQQNFAWCLAISWAGTPYIHFQGLLRSLILAVLLHGTPAVGISQTLWRGTRNGITEIHIFGWSAITLGSSPHSSAFFFGTCCIASAITSLREH